MKKEKQKVVVSPKLVHATFEGKLPTGLEKLVDKLYGGHPKFHAIMEELRQLHVSKSHDYAPGTDPLGNLQECSDMGLAPWKGVVVRLIDKMAKLKTFSRKGILKHESIIDTFNDISIYAILGRILYEQEREQPNTNTSGGKKEKQNSRP